MAATNDGGQAYPTPNTAGPDGLWELGYPGMTLRDWFAGQAINGLVTGGWGVSLAADKAKDAYVLADAMLAEREKNRNA